jgi:hypothetical protein
LPPTPPEQPPHVAQSANGIPQIADQVLQAPPNIVHSAPLPSPAATDKHLSAQNFAACTLMAANTNKVPAAVLIGMMHVEDSHIGKESKPDTNGDYDIGPMQISSRILPQLAQNWKVDIDTAHKRLRDDGCVNMDVAASILRKKIDAAGSLYVGIALYHSNTVEPDPAYADRVIKVMNESGLIKRDADSGRSINLTTSTAPAKSSPTPFPIFDVHALCQKSGDSSMCEYSVQHSYDTARAYWQAVNEDERARCVSYGKNLLAEVGGSDPYAYLSSCLRETHNHDAVVKDQQDMETHQFHY